MDLTDALLRPILFLLSVGVAGALAGWAVGAIRNR